MRTSAIAVIAILIASIAVDAGERVRVTSSITGLSVSYEPPRGWSYSAQPVDYGVHRSYEEWTIDRRVDRADSTITVRIDPVSNLKAAAEMHDCDPRAGAPVRTVGHVTIHGVTLNVQADPVTVADQNAAYTSVTVGDSLLSLQLDAQTQKQLRHDIPIFLSFLRTVRVENN